MVCGHQRVHSSHGSVERSEGSDPKEESHDEPRGLTVVVLVHIGCSLQRYETSFVLCHLHIVSSALLKEAISDCSSHQAYVSHVGDSRCVIGSEQLPQLNSVDGAFDFCAALKVPN